MKENIGKITTNQAEYRADELPSVVYGGVIEKDGVAKAFSKEGGSGVQIPEKLANNIKLALKVQDRVFSGDYPNLANRLAKLNCRKSVFTVLDKINLQEATEDSEDKNGIRLLLDDIMRTQQMGFKPQIISENYKDGFHEILARYEGKFPAVAHAFYFEKNSTIESVLDLDLDFGDGFVSQEVLSSIPRLHSFMILGKGDDYVCFHKKGPAVNQPFEITDLDSVSQYIDPDSSHSLVVFLGPGE